MEPIGERGGVKGTLDISVLIVAHNEEKHLADCLASAAFARERVVLLDRCSDRSGEVARGEGVRVVEGAWPLEGDRRNAGIALCTSPWILELDADERISDELREELDRVLGAPDCAFYYVPMHNYIGAVWVRHGWGAYNGVGAKPSLFRKGSKIWGADCVHPRLTLIGKGGWLHGHIDHFVYDDAGALINRLNRYSDAAACDAVLQGRRFRAHQTARRFFTRFYKSYCRRRGYREGWRGVLLALFSALYPVLTHLKALELAERRGRDG